MTTDAKHTVCEKCADPTRPSPRNRGAQLLRSFMVEHLLSTAELARLIALDQGSIKSWLTRARPNVRHAVILEDRVGIPVRAWNEPPTPDAT